MLLALFFFPDPAVATKVQTSDATAAPRTTRTKSGNIRAKGGLVHGTGRIKPNGTVKRTDSTTAVSAAPAPAPVQPAAPVKQRTIIDQGPIPLYCSDECRMSDLNSIYGVLSADYDPNREATPAVPHNSFTSICETESDSSSGGVSSVDSRSSISWSSSDSSRPSRVSPSIATLAAIYDFPPLPPPPPIIEQANSQSSNSDSEHNFDQYQSGVMMAARRIKAALCPEPVKRSAFNTAPPPPVSRDPIPGWTDGSVAWRSSVYSLSNPTTPHQAVGEHWSNNASKSIVASPHHSRGVQSTVGEVSTPTSYHNASTASLPVTRPTAPAAMRSVSYADDLYSKYPLSFSRRSESRTSLGIPGSYPTSSAASFRQQQEKSLLKPGAEGKLLVPDVKLKVKASSSLSPSAASSTSLSSWRSGSSYPASSRRSIRSPLNRHSSEFSEGTLSDQGSKSDDDEPLPAPRRPNVESKLSLFFHLLFVPNA